VRRRRTSDRRTTGRPREARRTTRAGHAGERRRAAEALAAAEDAKRSRLPVIGYQRWDEIAFLHWSVPPAAIRTHVDPRLELDLADGLAWISITPFTLRRARVRALPHLPALTEFHELNLRTYVRGGGVPGLWFFSLDAASWPAAAIARVTLGLPYFHARMERSASGGAHAYRSDRRAPGPRPASLEASWIVGDPLEGGWLDRFLVERYALYTRMAGALLRLRVRHPAWPLASARVERLEQTITGAAGLEVEPRPALAHFSRGVDVELFPPERV
jgi:uncharacterized protein YqjF (DUF2071 family)